MQNEIGVKCLLVWVFLWLVGAAAFAQEALRPIRIAGIFDLTSKAGSIWGSAEKNSFILAIDDFRKQHPNQEIEFAIENSAYSSSQSVSAFKKLTSVQGYKLVVGPTWEMFVATMPLCEAGKIVCLAPSNNSREFNDPKLRYSFSAYFRETGYTDVIADEINRRGLKRVALVAAVTPFYDPLVDNLVAKLKQAPVFSERVLVDVKDFRSIIPKIPKDVDAIVALLLNDGQLYKFLEQWQEQKRPRLPVFGDDSVMFDEQASKIRSFGLDIYSAQEQLDPDDAKRFDARYRAEYGSIPEATSAAIAYDSTMLLLNCAAQHILNEQVADCIRATNNYHGMSGIISFAGRQNVLNRLFVLKPF